MRKKFIISILLGSLLLSSCASSSKERFSEVKKSVQESKIHDFQLKIAENVVKNYFLFLLSDNYEKLNGLYSTEIKVDNIHKNDTNLRLRGYHIEEMSEIGRTAEFKVFVTFTDINKPLSMCNEYQIKVVKEDGLYRINEVHEIPHKELFVENDTIRLRDDNSVKSFLILDNSGIPKYITSDEKGEKYSKVENNIKAYQSINLNYQGNKICFSKKVEESKDCYLAIMDVNEVMLFNKDERASSAREEPIGDNIKTLDYLKDTKVEYCVFSDDNRYVAVQCVKNGLKRVKLYYVSSGVEIPLEIDEKLSMSDINVTFKSFHRDMVNLEVLPKNAENLNNSNLYGIWKLDIDDLKFHKI